MDYLTAALLALILLLILAVLWLGWRLRSRPLFKEEAGRLVAIPAPPPPLVACNMRKFIFQRYDAPTAQTLSGEVMRHPYCEHLPLETLTESSAIASWTAGHPEPDWALAEVRDEVHFLSP